VTIAIRPSKAGTERGELVDMICPTSIAKYFSPQDWTTQISLKWLAKIVFARRREARDEYCYRGANL
jgi:hypothetical protein